MYFSKDYIEPEKKLFGAWIKPDEKEDVEFRVRPYSKRTYYLSLGVDYDAKKAEIEAMDDDVKKAAELNKFMSRKLVETFLLDWKNVVINGEEVPFSVDKATDLLIGSETFMDLFNTAVDKVSTHIEERDDEIEKN